MGYKYPLSFLRDTANEHPEKRDSKIQLIISSMRVLRAVYVHRVFPNTESNYSYFYGEGKRN